MDIKKRKCSITRKGEKYGKLIILKTQPSRTTPKGQKYTIVSVKCECGNIKDIAYSSLRRKIVTDCGCNYFNPQWKDPKWVKNYMQEYYLKNREKIIKNNIKRGGIYKKYKKSIDPAYKLQALLRTRLYNALKRKSKKGSAIKLLGCSAQEAVKYIEELFLPGMTWSNWSWTGWHIDHIIPLSSFDLTSKKELKKACHYINLQPMWAIDNIKKSNKLI